MYGVYIIESSSGMWYYGSAADVEKRVSDHDSNRAKFTRNKGSWSLIFKRMFETKTEALKFELQLKRTRNKGYIRKNFSEYFLK